jgi:hypothetical protein
MREAAVAQTCLNATAVYAIIAPNRALCAKYAHRVASGVGPVRHRKVMDGVLRLSRILQHQELKIDSFIPSGFLHDYTAVDIFCVNATTRNRFRVNTNLPSVGTRSSRVRYDRRYPHCISHLGVLV